MHPTRLRRFRHFDYTGPHRYSLTLCAFARETIFVDAALVTTVIDQFLQTATANSFEILAYCVMPDHAHLVMHGVSASAVLPGFVKAAKQASGFHAKRIARRRIWQPGYFERVLRDTEDVREVIAYVLANPVRAGFVSSPDEWPFSGSGVCTLDELLEYVQDVRPT